MGTTNVMQSVTGTGCNDRLETTNDNNTVNFRAFSECAHGSATCTTPVTSITSAVGFSPDDIAQYDDED
jgi:hypothetical protein